jgi:hypothetical protein
VLAAAKIRAMMEAANTSETSVNFYQTTWRNNPEDNHLYTRCRVNLKSHKHFTTSRMAMNSMSPIQWVPMILYRG